MIYREVTVTVQRGGHTVVELYGAGVTYEEATEDALGARVLSEEERPRRGDKLTVTDDRHDRLIAEYLFDREVACRV